MRFLQSPAWTQNPRPVPVPSMWTCCSWMATHPVMPSLGLNWVRLSGATMSSHRSGSLLIEESDRPSWRNVLCPGDLQSCCTNLRNCRSRMACSSEKLVTVLRSSCPHNTTPSSSRNYTRKWATWVSRKWKVLLGNVSIGPT